MLNQNTVKPKVLITGIVTLFIFGLLFWKHFNGGVPSHHILHQKDLPAISNWWSGIFLPIITWILLGRIEKRQSKQTPQAEPTTFLKSRILRLIIIGLVFAIIISVSFINEYTSFLDYVLYVFLILSFFIPIYYSEFILGFILGMTYTFGALLPTAFIMIMAALGALIYLFIRPYIAKLIKIIVKLF